jgi:hypothetical protein
MGVSQQLQPGVLDDVGNLVGGQAVAACDVEEQASEAIDELFPRVRVAHRGFGEQLGQIAAAGVTAVNKGGVEGDGDA